MTEIVLIILHSNTEHSNTEHSNTERNYFLALCEKTKQIVGQASNLMVHNLLF